MTILRPLAAAALLLMSAGAQAQAAPPSATALPTDRVLSFQVTRDGGAIGFHTYAIHRRGDEVEVRVDADIRVGVFLIPFFVYEQKGVEIWKDGRLASMDYVTNDDGTRHTVKAEAEENGLRVSVDGKPARQVPPMIPGSLWRMPPPRADMMLDPGDGSPTPLTIRYLGADTIVVKGKPTKTSHWLWDDGLRREVWYDADQTLVQVWIKGDDGSDIYYVLK